MNTPSSTPLIDRLDRIRERRDTPRPLFKSPRSGSSPFVRAAREGTLRPKAFVAGAFIPDGSNGAA